MAFKGIQLVPEDTKFNFIGLRALTYLLSAFLLIGSVVMTSQQGLNFGIDFTGGTLIEIKTPTTPDLGMMREDLNALALGNIQIQEFGAPNDLLIRMPEQPAEEGVAPGDVQARALTYLRNTLDTMFEGEVDYRRTEFVGPQVGEELKQQGLYAVIFSMIGILAYVWFRFEWQFGVAAILALMHDVILTIGLFAVTQLEFNLSTVAAILMIAGYSINDTVVVFDRIRENLRKYKKMGLPDLFNMSVNQMLARTLMTSVTTLLALIALYVLGGEVIRDFIYALIFGVLIGTYSSIFVAAPTLLFMNIRRASFDEEEPGAEGQAV